MIPQWLVDLIYVAPWFVAMSALIIVAVKVWPYGQRLMRFIDDVAGEPARPGFVARPGLMERVERIEHEVRTNHGTSLKDSVSRIEVSQVEHRAENAAKFSLIDDRLAELADEDAQIRDDLENTFNPRDEK